jgi:hypothetical protein
VDTNDFILVFGCHEQAIEVPGIVSVERKLLTNIVIGLDLIIVIAFCIYTLTMDKLIKREASEFDTKTLTLTDFALKITNLPS